MWAEMLEPRRLLAGTVTDSLVAAGAAWRYLDTGADAGAAWVQPAFDDSAWKSGAAELGYGDGDEATRVSFGPSTTNRFVTTYFRHSFPATEISRYAALMLEIKRDDGALIYLNGREIARSNMPTGAISYRTLASTNVAGADELVFYPFSLSPSLLADGTNTLAVEVHQNAPASGDVSFDLRLSATRPDGVADNNPFTVVVIPDTQFYSQSYPATFNAQTQWIVDNAASSNIKFVTHTGDVIQWNADPAFRLTEWQRADAAMDKLDALPSLPYSVGIGNHDYDVKDSHAGPTARFTEFFGSSRYAGRSWYGGASVDQRNHYQVFGAAGRSFLHITVEFEAPDSALAWAQSVIDAHPDLPVILSTHSYLQSASARSTTTRNADGNSGEQMWQELVRRNPRVFMFLSGHVSSEARRTVTNDAGLPVFEIMADYQSRINGGDGWMRLLEFRPLDNRVDVKTWSPTLNRFEVDANSQFSLPLDFNTRLTFGTQPPPPPPPQTVTFQRGSNSYAAAFDTMLRQGTDSTGGPDTNLSASTILDIDDETHAATSFDGHALLRFDNLFSSAAGPIPFGSSILGATLTFQVTGVGSGMRLHRMLQPWSDTATWNSMGAGIQPDGVEAAPSPDASVGIGNANANITLGVLTIDVTPSLRAWSTGSPNHGWALLPLPGGTNGLTLLSSDGATITQRPKLTVTFTPPAQGQVHPASIAPPAVARSKLLQRRALVELLESEP